MNTVTRLAIVSILCVAALASPDSALSKIYVYGIYELVEQSDIIVIGTVTQVSENTARVNVEKAIRGRIDPGVITVTPTFFRTCLGKSNNFHIADRAVYYLKKDEKTADEYIVQGGGQGQVALSRIDMDAYLSALSRIIEIVEMNDERKMNDAMLDLISSPNSFLRDDGRMYVYARLLQSKILLEYKNRFTEMLHHKDKNMRMVALSGLAALNVDDIIPDVIEMTKDKDPEIVNTAVAFLGKYNTAETVHALVSLTRHDNPNIRSSACISLRNNNSDEARNAAIRLLYDNDVNVRAGAPYCIVFMLRDHDMVQVIPRLIEMLDDPEESVRLSAARTLGDSHSVDAVKALLNVLHRDGISVQMKGTIISSLDMLFDRAGDEGNSLIEAGSSYVAEYLKEGNSPWAFSAVGLLSHFESPEAKSAFQWAAKNHPDKNVRDFASYYLRNATENK